MKKSYILLLFITAILKAQPDTLWTKTFDYFDFGVGTSVQQTMDGGYILTGFNYAPVSSIIIKTDSNGEEEWVQYSSSIDYSVQQTTDGGYIITGWESGDIHITKTDENGNVEWSQTFGGDDGEGGHSIQQTTDGGYIITGGTSSYGNGGSDVWLVKTNANGDSVWSQTFGGNEYDRGYSVQQTSDGGYIITGYKDADVDQISYSDIWLIKTDSDGDSLWSKTFGGDGLDLGYSVQQTTDGEYIIVGETRSYGNGWNDVWLIKTDSNGDSLWTRTFGGSDSDIGRSVKETTDGGYIIAGNTGSFGNGAYDVWLIKTDSAGNEEWNQTFGGSANDEGWSVQQISDGDYIITGSRATGAGHAIWLIKTVRESLSNIVINEIMQNPSSVSDSDGEWFELYNAGEDTVDISGWVFKDDDDDSLSLDVDCCLNIPPNGYFLMICNGDSAINGGISNYDFIYEREAFNLGNGDDEIIIIDSYGREVDRVEYSSNLNFPDPNGKSMELTFYDYDNNVGSNWVESTNMLPSGDYGTPGIPNSMIAPSINILSVNTEQEYLLVNPQTYEPPELGDCLIMNYPYEYVGPCDSAFFDIVIQNSGTSQLIINDYHFTDELFPIVDNRWNVVDTLPIIIPPASNDTIQVRFIPWRYTNFDYWFGIRENTLVLENNDPDNDSVSVDLSIPVVLNGTGYTLSIYGWTPEWTADGPNQPIVDFGTVSVGDSLDTTIVLTSYGIEELEVDGVSPADMPFSLVSDDGEMNLFESIDIEITFTPEEFGDFADTIYVESNAQMFYPVFTIDTGSPDALPPEPWFIIKGIGWECPINCNSDCTFGHLGAFVVYLSLGDYSNSMLFDIDYNGTIDIIDLLIFSDIVTGYSDYYDCSD